MTLPLYATIDIHQFQQGALKKGTMEIATEYPVALSINGNILATIAVSASDLRYLALGHLISEGIIVSYDDVESISFNEKDLALDIKLIRSEGLELKQAPRIVTGGGRGKILSAPQEFVRCDLPEVDSNIVTYIAGEFLQPSELRKLTRGFHAAALYSLDGEKLAFFDEIGRHSAIDKIIGFACENNINLKDKIILSTGRVSSEIAGKIIYSGVPVFISRASPTLYAVELLQKYRVIFICKASDEGFTVVGEHDKIIVKTSS